MQKCDHGENWSLCFRAAQEKGRFLEGCWNHIEERMLQYFEGRVAAEEARDCCQELGMQLSRSFSNFQDQGTQGKGYVYKIAQNILVGAFRKNGKRQRAWREEKEREEAFVTEDEAREQDEITEVVRHCLSLLPAKYENIIALRGLQELRAEEVEKITRIPIRTQYHYYKMGIELLKKCFEKQGLERR